MRGIWNLDNNFLSKIPRFSQLNIEFSSQITKKNTASTAYLATIEERISIVGW
jgi:hypothetical protein